MHVEIDDIEHLWIEMPDGVRLAARMWIPKSAYDEPLPAIFEYIPYRKRDMVRARDERNHPFLATQGFVSLRIDMRGSGDSEGLMQDMYEPKELSDAHYIIEWIAKQEWCNGSVGMFGTSWGGTAALQACCNAPKALRAVIAVCATHDRYEDDIHHMGGCLLTDSIEWGTTFPAILASPPSAETGHEEMLEMWQHRLGNLAFPLENWVQKEARGEYWRHGSVIHSADDLSCPILAVGGWSDRYSNSVMSLMEARPELVWGIVGPWGHHFPDHGHPAPAIGFQEVMADWWRRWLVDDKKTEKDWPKLRCWLGEFEEPADVLEVRNGNWIEHDPESERLPLLSWNLTQKGLESPSDTTEDKNNEGVEWKVPFDLSVGGCSGDTGYFGRYGGLPLDQRDDDLKSLCFDTKPLDADVICLGKAQITLVVDHDDPVSQLCIRLNEVEPDGTSAKVAMAVINLALDEHLDKPKVKTPGSRREVTIPFSSRAHRFQAGNRIRISISSSYWPMVWPSPRKTKIAISRGELSIPCHLGEPIELKTPFPQPVELPREKTHKVLEDHQIVRYSGISNNGSLKSGWHKPFSSLYFPSIETTFGYETKAEYQITPDNPSSAYNFFTHRLCYERTDGTFEVKSAVTCTCHETHFSLNAEITVMQDEDIKLHRNWQSKIPRKVS